MNFNTIVKINHLEELAEEFSYFNKINYKLNYGARYKWSRIWSMIKKLGLLNKNFTCIDIGGGLSPIHFILSNYGKVINIDYSGFKASWFPVNSQGFYTKSIGIESEMRNIFYIKDDFLQYVKGINDNSIDFIIDGCSFIHFNPTKIFSHNDGITSGMKQIDRILKPGGHFISCSDVAHPLFPESQDMIHPEHLGECFTSSGLNYISESDWDLENFL